jgi:hypothetical protein
LIYKEKMFKILAKEGKSRANLAIPKWKATAGTGKR